MFQQVGKKVHIFLREAPQIKPYDMVMKLVCVLGLKLSPVWWKLSYKVPLLALFQENA